MKITNFRAENFARIHVIDIAIDEGESVVELHGENGVGKSSILNGIQAVIDGGRQLEEPIHRGQQKAVVELELADKKLAERLTATRTFTRAFDKDGKETIESKLTVMWKEGAWPRMSPQATMDALAGDCSFDPAAFLLLKPEEQGESVRKLVGLDFSPLERKADTIYAQRTEVNVAGKSKKARLDAMPPPSGLARVEVKALLEEQARIFSEQQRSARLESAAQDATRRRETAQRRVSDTKADIAQLERQLEAARARLAGEEQAVTVAMETETTAEDACFEPPELDEVRAKIAAAEEINTKVAADVMRAALEAEVAELRVKSVNMTKELDDIEAEKVRQLAEAKFPIPGLGFNKSGATLNGLPFAQASGAERLRAAMAIGIAATAKLKVVRIHEASAFDKKSRAMIAEMAKAAGAQVWLCTVQDGASGFEIVEGEVAPKRVGKSG